MLKRAQTIKRLFVLSVAILPLLLTSGLQAAPLTRNSAAMMPFVSRAGAFSVLMPGQPQHSSSEIDTPFGRTTLHKFNAETDGGDYAYLVMYADYPSDMSRIDKATLLANICAKGAAGVNGRVVSGKRVSMNGYPGYMARTESDKFTFLHMVYLAGQRLYQVIFTMPKGYQFPANIRSFYDSFTITA